MAAKKKMKPARAAKPMKTKKLATKMKAKATAVVKKARAKAMPIPKGFRALTPALVVDGAAEAIAFYKNAFGAKQKSVMSGPDGRIMHAEIQIGDSMLMLSDESPQMGSKSPKTLGGTASGVMVYTKNVDKLFDQAVRAGAKVLMPVSDMFWGDRYGRVEDPFGHVWDLATHKEDVTSKQMAKRAAAAMAPPAQA
jgi:PhnB protein